MGEKVLTETNDLAYLCGHYCRMKEFYSIGTRSQCHDTRIFVPDTLGKYARVFVLGKTLQPDLTFAVKYLKY